MIFNHDILFIHIGKTGGMSCAAYLLRNLRGPVYNCNVNAVRENARVRRSDLQAITDITRHCTLNTARNHVQQITGIDVRDMARIVAVIRHPFTLEYSFYRHAQKPRPRARLSQSNPRLVELANGDFHTFVTGSGFHGIGLPQQGYFLLDGQLPENLTLVSFENLEAEFTAAVGPWLKDGAEFTLPKLNSSEPTGNLRSLLDEKTRSLLVEKHRYMFEMGYYAADLPE